VSLQSDLDDPRAWKMRGKGEDVNPLNEFKMASRLASPGYIKQVTSGKPEAMMKVVSFARGHRVGNVMNYIARTEKEDQEELALEDQHGVLIEGKEEISELRNEWSTDFERAKPRTDEQIKAEKAYKQKKAEWEKLGKQGKPPRKPKGAPRHATHFILSANAPNDKRTSVLVQDAARDVLSKTFGKAGYEYVFVTHNDTKNPHVHVVMKNHNQLLNKKLRLDKNDLANIRVQFAKSLEARGIEQAATMRRDRTNTYEKILSGVERTNNKLTWFQAKIKDRENTPTNMVSVLEQQSKNITRMEKQLKQAKLRPDLHKKAKSELYQLKQNLLDPKGRDADFIIASTVKSVEKDFKNLGSELSKLKEIKQPVKREAKQAKKSEIMKMKKKINNMAANQVKEITKASNIIKKSKLDAVKKKEALDNLKTMQKQIQKQFGFGMVFGR